MNISKFDVSVLFILALAVVLISFTGPVFGLTDADATNESEIPNLTVGQNQFDVAGEFPEQPTTPDSGRLVFYENNTPDTNTIWIDGGDTSDGTQIFTSEFTNNTTDVDIVRFSNGNEVYRDTYTLTDEGDGVEHTNNSWNIKFELESEQEPSPSDYKSTTLFTVNERPGSGDFLGTVPIVGDVLSAGSDVAAMVGWIGSIIFYLFIVLGETILNAALTLVDVTVYLISMVGWMFSTYLSVVDGAPGWASVIVALPGVLFAAVLAKFVAVGVALLPTT